MLLFSKKENQEFVKEYGKSWKQIEDKIFLWILTSTLLSVKYILALFISFLALSGFAQIGLSTQYLIQDLPNLAEPSYNGNPINQQI